MRNTSPTPFKRSILRAVLNDVSPIVAQVFSISDGVKITELRDMFLSMRGWCVPRFRSRRTLPMSPPVLIGLFHTFDEHNRRVVKKIGPVLPFRGIPDIGGK